MFGAPSAPRRPPGADRDARPLALPNVVQQRTAAAGLRENTC